MSSKEKNAKVRREKVRAAVARRREKLRAQGLQQVTLWVTAEESKMLRSAVKLARAEDWRIAIDFLDRQHVAQQNAEN